MNVKWIIRKPRPSDFRIEGLFKNKMAQFDHTVDAVKWECPNLSSGLIKRLGNVMAVRRVLADVYHITGDIHYLAMALPKKATILTVHDAAVLGRLSGIRRLIYIFFWFDWPMRSVALVTVISEATRQHLLANTKICPEKIRVIPDCISETFTPKPRDFNQARPLILQIGTKTNKNIERVAEALRGLSCELRIIGKLTKEQVASLERSEVAYSSASNLSEEELVREYQNCDILIFASLIEGFGMPILEAQVTGRVVVTSNCSSMPEVAGSGACFVDPSKVQSIQAGLLRVIEDEAYRNLLINRGYENARRFSVSIVAKQYAILYAELARSVS